MGKTLSKWIYKKREVRVLMVGLDAAGKTTVLYQLKLGEVVTTIPTIGFNVETLETDDVNITAWDVGLRGGSRPLLRHYYANTNAVVFVVDSVDRERLKEAKDFLHELHKEDELRGAAILVMANKQDHVKAMSKEFIAEKLELRKIVDREWNIVACSAVKNEGLQEGLDWLAGVLSGKIMKNDLTQSLMTSVNDVTTTAAKVQEKSDYYGFGMIKAGLGWIQHLSGCKSQAASIGYKTAGLDAAGKTSILCQLKLGEVVNIMPTIGMDFEKLETDDFNITAWDIGVRGGSRALLRHLYHKTDGVVFVVDSVDKERLNEAKDLLGELLSADELRFPAILVMANKQDHVKAMSKEFIAEKLELRKIVDREWNIVACSAVKNEGLQEGLDWLAGVLSGKIMKNDVTQSLMTSVNDVTMTAAKVQEKSGYYGFGKIKAGLGWIQHLSGCKS